MNTADGRDDAPESKVATFIDEYGLDEEFGRRLKDLWTTDNDERESLRLLTDIFNEALLEAAMTDAGMTTLQGEVDNLYTLLTDDNVSSGARTEARKRLEQRDVDVDQLLQDFVTYQAIRSYLVNYRGVEYESNDGETRVATVIETVQRLQSRTDSVVEKSLQQLCRPGRISIGEFRPFVIITVLWRTVAPSTESSNSYGTVAASAKSWATPRDNTPRSVILE